MKVLLPIEVVAAKLDLPETLYERRSQVTAKLSLDLLDGLPGRAAKPGKLILVTATTPTLSGEGKTVTAIGLAQGWSEWASARISPRVKPYWVLSSA